MPKIPGMIDLAPAARWAEGVPAGPRAFAGAAAAFRRRMNPRFSLYSQKTFSRKPICEKSPS